METPNKPSVAPRRADTTLLSGLFPAPNKLAALLIVLAIFVAASGVTVSGEAVRVERVLATTLTSSAVTV